MIKAIAAAVAVVLLAPLYAAVMPGPRWLVRRLALPLVACHIAPPWNSWTLWAAGYGVLCVHVWIPLPWLYSVGTELMCKGNRVER